MTSVEHPIAVGDAVALLAEVDALLAADVSALAQRAYLRMLLVSLHSRGRPRFGVNEMARRLAANHGNMSRALRQLGEAGFLERDDAGWYLPERTMALLGCADRSAAAGVAQ